MRPLPTCIGSSSSTSGGTTPTNYFFSQGCDRYEDPLLFATQDRVSARCRRIYCAADVPLSRVFSRPEAPLYYTYALPNGRELKIVLDDTVALKLFG